MNENWGQDRDDGMDSWQETPYVSRFTAETARELEAQELTAQVATKSFAVVFRLLYGTHQALYAQYTRHR